MNKRIQKGPKTLAAIAARGNAINDKAFEEDIRDSITAAVADSYYTGSLENLVTLQVRGGPDTKGYTLTFPNCHANQVIEPLLDKMVEHYPESRPDVDFGIDKKDGVLSLDINSGRKLLRLLNGGLPTKFAINKDKHFPPEATVGPEAKGARGS